MDGILAYAEAVTRRFSDVTGVPVVLQAIGSDGSVIDIGTTTTDCQGHFSYMWTPPGEGLYTITAFFAGDDSYWGSWAETPLGVTAFAPAPAYTLVDLVIIIVVIIVAIIAVANFMALRKLRK